MSRSCELTGVKKQMGRYVPVERSQTGVRTLRSFEPNMQEITLISDAIGKVGLRLAVRTIRSVEHNGGLDKFLLGQSASKLTTRGQALKKQIKAALKAKNALPVWEKAKRHEPKVTPKRAAAAAKKAGTAKPKAEKATKAKAAPKKKAEAKK